LKVATITKKEIAAYLGVSLKRLGALGRTGTFSLPAPVGKQGFIILYDRALTLQYLAYWKEAKTTRQPDVEKTRAPTYLEVMTGQYDREDLKKGYLYRIREASKNKPKTVKERTKYAN
jgi:hypothetical protein